MSKFAESTPMTLEDSKVLKDYMCPDVDLEIILENSPDKFFRKCEKEGFTFFSHLVNDGKIYYSRCDDGSTRQLLYFRNDKLVLYFNDVEECLGYVSADDLKLWDEELCEGYRLPFEEDIKDVHRLVE